MANIPKMDEAPGKEGVWNWNTRLGVMLCIASGVADSIWIGTVLTSFLFGLARVMNKESDENTLVGLGEGSWGISQLIFAIPVGFLADKWSKAKTIRLGSLFMMFIIAFTWWSVEKGTLSELHDSQSEAKTSYISLLLCLVGWGIVGGITNGPGQALFADSLAPHLRTEGYTYLMGSYLVASSLGPLVSIAMFSRLSDKYKDWDLEQIRPVFLLGLSLEVIVVGIMFFFRDVRPHASEEIREAKGEFSNRTIPLILFASSLVSALGSGASVGYFPLFFKEVGMSPEQVQWIFVLSPLSIAAMTVLAKYVGDYLGSIRAVLCLQSGGCVLLMVLSALHSRFQIDNGWVLVPLYLLRTSLMNCTYPMMESVLMSSVPSHERSRWKSLEAVAAFSWTGSAVAGGVLADRKGYSFAFMITACVQLLGTWMLFPLHKLVVDHPQEEEEERTTPNVHTPLLLGTTTEDGEEKDAT